jgi:hypothetical protein
MMSIESFTIQSNASAFTRGNIVLLCMSKYTLHILLSTLCQLANPKTPKKILVLQKLVPTSELLQQFIDLSNEIIEHEVFLSRCTNRYSYTRWEPKGLVFSFKVETNKGRV